MARKIHVAGGGGGDGPLAMPPPLWSVKFTTRKRERKTLTSPAAGGQRRLAELLETNTEGYLLSQTEMLNVSYRSRLPEEDEFLQVNTKIKYLRPETSCDSILLFVLWE